ncbi:hypothetical protein EJ04DRAFT_218069 [Polyplosphaeria fusca]|uniref:Uncharacterized protein n=1 Tax=Polyplosphaeria fusca TaxID=682080 RepID=A0A9P4R1Y9_9PLEO|nr:hypothetical protein EJ04DRAFT_218069 [Polyplosphaeria fusca]
MVFLILCACFRLHIVCDGPHSILRFDAPIQSEASIPQQLSASRRFASSTTSFNLDYTPISPLIKSIQALGQPSGRLHIPSTYQTNTMLKPSLFDLPNTILPQPATPAPTFPHL